MELEEMRKKREFWFGTTMLLLGVVVGYFIAPIKKGVNIKNICGNGWNAQESLNAEDDDFEECEDDTCEDCEELKF